MSDPVISWWNLSSGSSSPTAASAPRRLVWGQGDDRNRRLLLTSSFRSTKCDVPLHLKYECVIPVTTYNFPSLNSSQFASFPPCIKLTFQVGWSPVQGPDQPPSLSPPWSWSRWCPSGKEVQQPGCLGPPAPNRGAEWSRRSCYFWPWWRVQPEKQPCGSMISDILRAAVKKDKQEKVGVCHIRGREGVIDSTTF